MTSRDLLKQSAALACGLLISASDVRAQGNDPLVKPPILAEPISEQKDSFGVTTVFALRNADAAKTVDSLQTLIRGLRVTADPRTNSIAVQSTKEMQAQVAAAVQKLDVPAVNPPAKAKSAKSTAKKAVTLRAQVDF